MPTVHFGWNWDLSTFLHGPIAAIGTQTIFRILVVVLTFPFYVVDHRRLIFLTPNEGWCPKTARPLQQIQRLCDLPYYLHQRGRWSRSSSLLHIFLGPYKGWVAFRERLLLEETQDDGGTHDPGQQIQEGDALRDPHGCRCLRRSIQRLLLFMARTILHHPSRQARFQGNACYCMYLSLSLSLFLFLSLIFVYLPFLKDSYDWDELEAWIQGYLNGKA